MQENHSGGSRKAFVIMPFKEPINACYKNVFKPALIAAGYTVHRVDEIYKPNVIIRDIQKSVMDADLILCELTGRNPNVLYELGLAHAVGKPAILVTRNKKDVPFDLSHIRYIPYDTAIPGWGEKLKSDITRSAESVALSGQSCFQPLMPEKIGVDEIVAYHPNGCQGDLGFLGSSNQIAMLSITLRGLLEYTAVLKKAMTFKNANVRLLILNPESRFLRQRAEQEGGEQRIDQIISESKSTIDRAKELVKLIKISQRPASLELRLYDTMPYCKCFITEVLVRYMPYLMHDRSGCTPAIDIVPSGQSRNQLDAHFDSLWKHKGTTVAVKS
jgi:hypothetical protein